jgi:hypothetical protein
VSKISFKNVNNKIVLLEHFLPKFEHNTQSASETSFLGIQIQNNTQLSLPPPIAPWSPQTRLQPETVYPFCTMAPTLCQVVSACSKLGVASGCQKTPNPRAQVAPILNTEISFHF